MHDPARLQHWPVYGSFAQLWFSKTPIALIDWELSLIVRLPFGHIFTALIASLSAFLRGRAALHLEILALCHQIGVLQRSAKRLRHGRDGRAELGWFRGERLPKAHGGDNTAGTNRSAAGHCDGRGVFFFRRCKQGDGADAAADGWCLAVKSVIAFYRVCTDPRQCGSKSSDSRHARLEAQLPGNTLMPFLIFLRPEPIPARAITRGKRRWRLRKGQKRSR
jgi:hypothetical protein